MRRVADAGIGTALGSDIQLEGQDARGHPLDRQADRYRLVIDLDLAEIVVILFLALGKDRLAERGRVAVDGEAEFIAVEVVALGDFVADFQGLPVQGLQRRLEGNGRVEEVLGLGERTVQ